jgi:dUTP diphosphatase
MIDSEMVEIMDKARMETKIFLAHKKAKLPFRASEYAAAWDIYTVDAGELYPEDTKAFSTGLIIEPPYGYHIKIWGRSGWGFKYGIGIPHGMGLIDADYCGPDDIIKVILHRTCGNGMTAREHTKPLKIEVGDRIAQMTLEKTTVFDFREVSGPPLPFSRGGFGNSGIK